MAHTLRPTAQSFLPSMSEATRSKAGYRRHCEEARFGFGTADAPAVLSVWACMGANRSCADGYLELDRPRSDRRFHRKQDRQQARPRLLVGYPAWDYRRVCRRLSVQFLRQGRRDRPEPLQHACRGCWLRGRASDLEFSPPSLMPAGAREAGRLEACARRPMPSSKLETRATRKNCGHLINLVFIPVLARSLQSGRRRFGADYSRGL